MNLFKNQTSYLISLVKSDLEKEKRLPQEMRNVHWEANLKEIIETLQSQLGTPTEKREYVLGEWVTK